MKSIKVPEQLIALLDEEARKSNVTRSQMSAAVIMSDWIHIVSKTHNIRVYGDKHRWTLHAEERLLLKLRYPVTAMIVYRANGAGTSKPCRRCAYAMWLAGVQNVFYNDGKRWVAEKVHKLYKFPAENN